MLQTKEMILLVSSQSHININFFKLVFQSLKKQNFITHPLKLKSAYSYYLGYPSIEPFSHYNLFSGIKKTLDYIWFSEEQLIPIQLLEIPNFEPLPSKYYPSDHFSLLCQFIMKNCI